MLKDIPEHKRTRRWILSEIQYEESPGVHTYHNCKCGRMRTRAGRCAKCWKDCLEELRNEE